MITNEDYQGFLKEFVPIARGYEYIPNIVVTQHTPPKENIEMDLAGMQSGAKSHNVTSYATILTGDVRASLVMCNMLKRHVKLIPGEDFVRHYGGARGGSFYTEIVSQEGLAKLEKFVKNRNIFKNPEKIKQWADYEEAALRLSDDERGRFTVEHFSRDIERGFLDKLLGREPKKDVSFLIRVNPDKFPSREQMEIFANNLIGSLSRAGFVDDGKVSYQEASRFDMKRPEDVFDEAGVNKCNLHFSMKDGELKNILIARINEIEASRAR